MFDLLQVYEPRVVPEIEYNPSNMLKIEEVYDYGFETHLDIHFFSDGAHEICWLFK
jgi:hypothetical protein